MKITKIITFLMAVFVMLSTIPTYAATIGNWVKVAETDNSQWFVSDSIRTVDGEVECWFTINYSKPQLVGNITFLSVLYCYRFDCSNRVGKEQAEMRNTEVDRGGKTVYWENWFLYPVDKQPKPIRVIPGTAMEAVMKFACQRIRQE
ncbi:hypothetical protein HGA88_07050 [Candidatus Roizmanbacteria bacterium]|nr:hypothetical protein [Candidatus Roizmanbacteria bacterium]